MQLIRQEDLVKLLCVAELDLQWMAREALCRYRWEVEGGSVRKRFAPSTGTAIPILSLDP